MDIGGYIRKNNPGNLETTCESDELEFDGSLVVHGRTEQVGEAVV
jgi:hypothetical protein